MKQEAATTLKPVTEKTGKYENGSLQKHYNAVECIHMAQNRVNINELSVGKEILTDWMNQWLGST